MPKITTPRQLVAAYRKYGSIKAAARETGTYWRKTQALYTEAVHLNLMEPIRPGAKSRQQLAAVAKGQVLVKPLIEGRTLARRAPKMNLKETGVTRFLFTSAQNNTKLHEAFWENLIALKGRLKAELHISRFAYIKSGMGARGDKKHWFDNEDYKAVKGMWFDDRIAPYISDERRLITKGLYWCGEQNILPTAARPLNGLETITGRDAAIFPHTKIAMESIATAADHPAKFIYTTGAVTLRNYIARKEGLKAEFHHAFGALLVEVRPDGIWFARQINADTTGTFYLLDPDGDACMRVSDGEITTGHPAEALQPGDIHESDMCPKTRRAIWGKGGMLDTLKAKRQFFHDTLSSYPRNHHEIDDEIAMYERHVEGRDDVRKEVVGCVDFFEESYRPWCKTIVVNSNHDRALMKWLRNHKIKHDPVNLRFRSAMRDRLTAAIEEGRGFIAFKEAYLMITGKTAPPPWLQFLDEDEQYIICENAGGGIDCGQHGDRGPNGSRGSRQAFTRSGTKMNIGHSHTAGITDGISQAGTCAVRQKYEKGQSSHSSSHIVTFPNGKRAIYTIIDGEWRA